MPPEGPSSWLYEHNSVGQEVLLSLSSFSCGRRAGSRREGAASRHADFVVREKLINIHERSARLASERLRQNKSQHLWIGACSPTIQVALLS